MTIHSKIAAGLSAVALTIVMCGNLAAQSKKQRKIIAKANALTETNLRQHISVLASDSLEGRRTGTAGEAKAAAYLEAYYRKLGIPGAAANGSYQQPFEVDEGKVLGQRTSCRLNGQLLQPGSDFFPMVWSASGSVSQNTQVALHESGNAWWYDINDDLEANKNNPHLLPESLVKDKAAAAAAKGATALLVYNSGSIDDALKFNGKDRSDMAKIPVIYFTKKAAAAHHINSQADIAIAASVHFEAKTRKGINVAAYIDRQAPNTIILGAHLDHLGYGEDSNSRHTGAIAIHNGADDNASGTAALLELARILQQQANLRFNILLLHFSGEELGLYGSKYYTANPLQDLNKAMYMINMDMVGRLNDSSKVLTLGGVGTSPSWGSILNLDAQKDFTIKIDSSGTGPSDHTSFYRKDMPVLFFFTGLHTDYHKPSDDAALINYAGETSIINYIVRIINATPVENKLVFTKTREQNMGTGRFKVSIGIMPDYTFSGQGVKADGVIEGRPAQKAGLQAGDVIIQLGEHLITGVDTYMQALNRFEKGESITIIIKRNASILHLPITF